MGPSNEPHYSEGGVSVQSEAPAGTWLGGAPYDLLAPASQFPERLYSSCFSTKCNILEKASRFLNNYQGLYRLYLVYLYPFPHSILPKNTHHEIASQMNQFFIKHLKK